MLKRRDWLASGAMASSMVGRQRKLAARAWVGDVQADAQKMRRMYPITAREVVA